MHPTTIDLCEHTLRRAILGGELAVGARLAPERTLAAHLQVHRATLRTALARLTASGLVAPRQGSGYEVQPWQRTGGPELLGDLLDLATGPALELHASDLLRARRALSRAVLETLAERPPSDEARDAITAAIAVLAERVAQGGVEEIARADLAVVGAVLAATGSATLQLCTSPIASLVAGAPRLREAIYADARDSLVGWQALSAWLASPDPRAIDSVLEVMAARDRQTLARLSSTATEAR